MDSTFESGLHIRIWTPHSNMDSIFEYGLHIQVVNVYIIFLPDSIYLGVLNHLMLNPLVTIVMFVLIHVNLEML